MTDKTTETKENSEVIQKSEDTSMTSIVAEILKNQEKRIDSFEKKFDDIADLIKEHNKNPVDKGVEAENKPKTADANDVGDKVTVGNEVAPVPSEAQASIIAPAVEASSSDAPKLQMENKADEEKKPEAKEDKKEEVTKTEGDEKDEDKKEDVKKSDDSEYEFVKTVRPILKGIQYDSEKTVPTGYQVLKSIVSGWGGKTSSAEEALSIAYSKLESGELGNGLPQGVY